MKLNINQIRPTGTRILVERHVPEITSASGIVLDAGLVRVGEDSKRGGFIEEKSQEEDDDLFIVKVLAKGGVSGIAIGSLGLLPKYRGIDINKDRKYFLVDWTDLVAYYI